MKRFALVVIGVLTLGSGGCGSSSDAGASGSGGAAGSSGSGGSAGAGGSVGDASANDAAPVNAFEGVVFKGTVDGFAVDGAYAYFTDTWNAKLQRVSVSGGPPETLLASGAPGYPTSVVVDATHVYVGTDLDENLLLLRVSKSTKELEVLAARNCQNIVGSSAFVFCSTHYKGGVVRVKKDDMSGAVVWSEEFDYRFGAFAADETQFVALDHQPGPTAASATKLAIAPHTAENPSVISLTTPGSAIAAHEGVVWIATYDEPARTVALSRVVDGALTPVTTFSGAARGFITSLAVDATHVYYTTSGGAESAEVARVPINGGVSARIAEAREPHAITLDDAAVYWVGADVGEKPDRLIERRLKSKIPR